MSQQLARAVNRLTLVVGISATVLAEVLTGSNLSGIPMAAAAALLLYHLMNSRKRILAGGEPA